MNHNLPKPHLSPSQIELWLSNNSEYIQRYFLGKYAFVTEQMKTGKNFELDFLSDIPEADQQVEVRISVAGIPMLGFMDYLNRDANIIIEIKTGKGWTQDKVNSSIQLAYYLYAHPQCTARVIYSAKGTDEYVTFSRGGLTSEERTKFEDLVVRVASEISDAYTTHLNLGGDAEFIDLVEVHKKAKELTDRADKALREFITRKNIKHFNSSFVSIYEQKRTKYEYTEEEQSALSEAKQTLKKFEDGLNENAKKIEVSTIAIKIK